jgi:hypothetical protein
MSRGTACRDDGESSTRLPVAARRRVRGARPESDTRGPIVWRWKVGSGMSPGRWRCESTVADVESCTFDCACFPRTRASRVVSAMGVVPMTAVRRARRAHPRAVPLLADAPLSFPACERVYRAPPVRGPFSPGSSVAWISSASGSSPRGSGGTGVVLVVRISRSRAVRGTRRTPSRSASGHHSCLGSAATRTVGNRSMAPESCVPSSPRAARR